MLPGLSRVARRARACSGSSLECVGFMGMPCPLATAWACVAGRLVVWGGPPLGKACCTCLAAFGKGGFGRPLWHCTRWRRPSAHAPSPLPTDSHRLVGEPVGESDGSVGGVGSFCRKPVVDWDPLEMVGWKAGHQGTRMGMRPIARRVSPRRVRSYRSKRVGRPRLSSMSQKPQIRENNGNHPNQNGLLCATHHAKALDV